MQQFHMFITWRLCVATHKCQVINLWNRCMLLVDLFELYDDVRTCPRQIHKKKSWKVPTPTYFGTGVPSSGNLQTQKLALRCRNI
jgi:hypothetical protein